MNPSLSFHQQNKFQTSKKTLLILQINNSWQRVVEGFFNIFLMGGASNKKGKVNFTKLQTISRRNSSPVFVDIGDGTPFFPSCFASFLKTFQSSPTYYFPFNREIVSASSSCRCVSGWLVCEEMESSLRLFADKNFIWKFILRKREWNIVSNILNYNMVTIYINWNDIRHMKMVWINFLKRTRSCFTTKNSRQKIWNNVNI